MPIRETYIPVEALGMTEEMAEEAAKAKAALGSKETWAHFTPEFVGTKAQTVDVPIIFDQIAAAQKAFQEARISQPEGRVKINTDLPIAIAHLGDLHLGSVYTDAQEIRRKFHEVEATPNVYCVFMGNLVENGIPAKYPESMTTQVIPPEQQVVMMRQMIKDLSDKGKVLAAVESACHEGWTYRVAAQDINALIFGFPERQFPVLENGGVLHLNVGGAEYTGALYHNVGPFESNFNETHAGRQMNRLRQQMQADWVAVGHKHVAAAEEVWEGTGQERKMVCYLRTGTEKGTGVTHDLWSQGRYGVTGEPSGQMLHLWPGEKQMMTNLDFDTGLLAHESIMLTALAQKK
jgi:hypothetical protein